MRIDAPKELSSWLSLEEARLLSHGITCDLRRPDQASDQSKASVSLNAGIVVGSLTIWATGMVELIAMDARTGDDLVARDVEEVGESDLRAALSRFVDEFIELVAAARE